jgi:hypothetical protein
MGNKIFVSHDVVSNKSLLTTSGVFLPGFISDQSRGSRNRDAAGMISVSTDFISGGGTVYKIEADPVVIRFKPHNEGDGGWSQVWWYFMVGGLTSGEKVTLELDRDDPISSGISPQIYFSYDRQVWGLTDTGKPAEIDGREFYVYNHIVRGDKVWFAYDLPYTPEHVENLLLPEANRDSGVEVFELCRTKNNRPVQALRFNDSNSSTAKRYGIWLQAGAHAFESGARWVLHELTRWLLSSEPEAKALRNVALITVVPIVDVDGVVEGRTGKYQKPYDHWMNWGNEPTYWPEINKIKLHLRELATQNMCDMFIDFHGPGNGIHPYFIVPQAGDLPHEKQRRNRSMFFKVLNSRPMDNKVERSQSMTQIHYSERVWDKSVLSSSHEWVTMETTIHNIAMTLEVNMNTPLSTLNNYRAEAVVLGKAMSEYFSGSNHKS